MACLLAPLTEALIISAAKGITNKVCAKKTLNDSEKALKLERINKKVNVLEKMLYGGSGLLAVEHIFHGEIVFYPPFLTAVKNGETAEMLHEIATTGVTMAVLVTAVWGIGVLIKSILDRKAEKKAVKVEE